MLYVDPIAQSRMNAVGIGVAGGARERRALEEFERLFLYEMLREMRKTVDQSSLLGGASHRNLFLDMMDDAVAGEMAKSGQLGVADLIEAQLRLQESQAALAQERRAEWAAALETGRFQGLPLRPAADAPPLPLAANRNAYFALPNTAQGLPLRAIAGSSPDLGLPIKETTSPGR